MSVELQNIVSKMMADSVPEEQIAAVIQQYKQTPPQPEVEQPGKAQAPQKDVTVESQEERHQLWKSLHRTYLGMTTLHLTT